MYMIIVEIPDAQKLDYIINIMEKAGYRSPDKEKYLLSFPVGLEFCVNRKIDWEFYIVSDYSGYYPDFLEIFTFSEFINYFCKYRKGNMELNSESTELYWGNEYDEGEGIWVR